MNLASFYTSLLFFVLLMLAFGFLAYFLGKRKGRSEVPPDELSKEIKSLKLPPIPGENL